MTRTLIVLLALVAVTTAQWVDRSLWVPDSLHSIRDIELMVADSASGLVWLAGFAMGNSGDTIMYY